MPPRRRCRACPVSKRETHCESGKKRRRSEATKYDVCSRKPKTALVLSQHRCGSCLGTSCPPKRTGGLTVAGQNRPLGLASPTVDFTPQSIYSQARSKVRRCAGEGPTHAFALVRRGSDTAANRGLVVMVDEEAYPLSASQLRASVDGVALGLARLHLRRRLRAGSCRAAEDGMSNRNQGAESRPCSC